MRLSLLWLLFSATLLGQSTDHQFLLFVGGSYLHVHGSGAEEAGIAGIPDYQFDQHNLNFGLAGWNTAVTEIIKPWFGADLDFGGDYGTTSPSFLCSASTSTNINRCFVTGKPLASVNTKLHTFTFGPRFTMRRFERMHPYAHVLLGYANLQTSISHSAIFLPTGALLAQNYSQSNSSFAAAPGVGIDLDLGPRVAVRLFEVDYLMTRFYSSRQDNARVSAGITFQFHP